MLVEPVADRTFPLKIVIGCFYGAGATCIIWRLFINFWSVDGIGCRWIPFCHLRRSFKSFSLTTSDSVTGSNCFQFSALLLSALAYLPWRVRSACSCRSFCWLHIQNDCIQPVFVLVFYHTQRPASPTPILLVDIGHRCPSLLFWFSCLPRSTKYNNQ